MLLAWKPLGVQVSLRGFCVGSDSWLTAEFVLFLLNCAPLEEAVIEKQAEPTTTIVPVLKVRLA